MGYINLGLNKIRKNRVIINKNRDRDRRKSKNRDKDKDRNKNRNRNKDRNRRIRIKINKKVNKKINHQNNVKILWINNINKQHQILNQNQKQQKIVYKTSNMKHILKN